MRLFVASVTTIALSMVVSGTANADSLHPDTPIDSLVTVNSRPVISSISEEEFQSIRKDIDSLQRLDPYFKNGTIDYAAAVSDDSIDKKVLDEYTSALQASSDTMHPDSPTSAVIKAMSACKGKNGWRAFWPTVFLNSCNASAVSNALNSGAGVAAVAAAITSYTGAGPVVAGAIAGALATYGGVYGLCNSWGRGIQLFLNPVNALPACWSQ